MDGGSINMSSPVQFVVDVLTYRSVFVCRYWTCYGIDLFQTHAFVCLRSQSVSTYLVLNNKTWLVRMSLTFCWKLCWGSKNCNAIVFQSNCFGRRVVKLHCQIVAQPSSCNTMADTVFENGPVTMVRSITQSNGVWNFEITVYSILISLLHAWLLFPVWYVVLTCDTGCN
jgi:hypothetical protein